jgi:hypothetical protein
VDGQAGRRRHPGGVDAGRRTAGRGRHPRRHRAASASCTTARTSTSPAPGDNSFIEDYTAEVRGRPLGCFHLVTFNADGQTQHIAAHYRPLSSLMFFSRLLRERLAGTPYAEHFLAGEA